MGNQTQILNEDKQSRRHFMVYGAPNLLEGIPLYKEYDAENKYVLDKALGEIFDLGTDKAESFDRRRYDDMMAILLDNQEHKAHVATSHKGTYIDQKVRVKAAWSKERYAIEALPKRRKLPAPCVAGKPLRKIILNDVVLNGVPSVQVDYVYKNLEYAKNNGTIEGTEHSILEARANLLNHLYQKTGNDSSNSNTYYYYAQRLIYELLEGLQGRVSLVQLVDNRKLADMLWRDVYRNGVYYPESSSEYVNGRWVNE